MVPLAVAKPWRRPVSVVIPVLDCATALPGCVGAIGRELDDRDEIVIADAGSRDGTAVVGRKLALDVDGVQFVRVHRIEGLAKAVEEGLGAATRGLALVLDVKARPAASCLTRACDVLACYPEVDAIEVPMAGARAAVLGSRPVLLHAASRSPEAFLEADAARLARELGSFGFTLALAPGPPRPDVSVPSDVRRRLAQAAAACDTVLVGGRPVPRSAANRRPGPGS